MNLQGGTGGHQLQLFTRPGQIGLHRNKRSEIGHQRLQLFDPLKRDGELLAYFFNDLAMLAGNLQHLNAMIIALFD